MLLPKQSRRTCDEGVRSIDQIPAAFLSFAHRFRCAAAILARVAALRVDVLAPAGMVVQRPSST
jgi:hypothetical protein